MKLFLNERPRTFVLVSNEHALIVRHPYPTYKKDSHHHLSTLNQSISKSKDSIQSKVIVEFVSADLVDVSKFQDITGTSSFIGLLGFFNMKGNIYLSFISKSTKVASPKVGENIHKIDSVEFFCLNSDEYDHIWDIPDHSSLDLNKIRTEYPAASVRKFLCHGDFFFSNDFDVTSTLQERGFLGVDPVKQVENFKLYADSPYFERFVWNIFLISELIQFRNRLTPFEVEAFDKCGFLITITRGYAKTVNVSLKSEDDALLTLINKQSCIKDGPLFGEWGADDKGAVSNFQELEIIIYTSTFCFSYIILKGNVPIFWETENHFSKGAIIHKGGGKKIIFPRSFETSHHTFKKHMDRLIGQYGDMHLISSIPSDSSNYKSVLGESLSKHLDDFNRRMTKAERFDNIQKDNTNDDPIYTLKCNEIPIKSSTIKKTGYTGSNPYKLISDIIDPMIEFGALFYDLQNNAFIGKQLGVFRITTYDSLSKANFLSKVICQEVIELALNDIGITAPDDLLIKHAKLWQECDEFINKNIVSFISYSTKLKGSSATSSKKNFKSKVSKKYLNSVLDPKLNETALLKLLGRLQDQTVVTVHNPIHDYIMKELEANSKQFTSNREIKLFSLTFNINGTTFKGDIKDWLFPEEYRSEKSYDLVLIGIQEIIELSASKMVNIDSENKRFWENHIKWHLNEFNPEGIKYLSLWSGQLGGLSLFIFVKQTEISKITQVESSFRKTGFGGVGANKGGIAVRFDYENTQICFVSSHLAAGLSNVDERHHDYKVISKGVKFSRNRRIKDHDIVVWLGDLNFRINLPNEQAKLLIEQKNFSKLFEYDQLNAQMANGESFPFFDEPEIKFPPTYKFDKNTKTYDTSEKQRIPAWTDRILYKSRNHLIKPMFYNCVEDIIFSDHRPVIGQFNLIINIENEIIKKNMRTELYDNYVKKFGKINDLFINNNNLSYIFEYDKNVLPPPSSDANKWWLAGGRTAKITIPELNKQGMIVNPDYPINPFVQTDQPEFIQRSSAQ